MLQDAVDKTLKSLIEKGYEVVGQACNVGKLDDIKSLIQLSEKEYGRIDVLVSNAAVNPASGGILELPDWAIDKLLSVNVKAHIQLIREAKPLMNKVKHSF